jgi:hypothetical protein
MIIVVVAALQQPFCSTCRSGFSPADRCRPAVRRPGGPVPRVFGRLIGRSTHGARARERHRRVYRSAAGGRVRRGPPGPHGPGLRLVGSRSCGRRRAAGRPLPRRCLRPASPDPPPLARRRGRCHAAHPHPPRRRPAAGRSASAAGGLRVRPPPLDEGWLPPPVLDDGAAAAGTGPGGRCCGGGRRGRSLHAGVARRALVGVDSHLHRWRGPGLELPRHRGNWSER